MHRAQWDVMDFHRALDIPVGETPLIRRPELRVKLIREESKELCQAIEDGDLIEAIDGMCDLLVVTYGAAVEFGIDLEPFWIEVHKTNMAKRGGPTREDGKKLKPPGWQPPNLAPILAAQVDPYYMMGHVDGCELWAESGIMQHNPAPGCQVK